MIRRFAKSTTLTIIFLAILLYAALSPMPVQAMKRESARPVQGEIVEGRSVIVNVPGRNAYTFILEV